MFAKHAYPEMGTGGSNPPLSATKHWDGLPGTIASTECQFSGCSVARLSRLLWEQEVAGSNPATPTKGQLGLPRWPFILNRHRPKR